MPAGGLLDVVNRLSPQGISPEIERPFARPPHGERIHSFDPSKTVHAPCGDGMKQYLGIRSGAEPNTLGLEMLPQFDKIVDLAIEDENVAGIGMHHRLAAIIAEIDDAEPVVTKCERFARFDMHAMIIRSAMAQAFAHCREHGRGVACAIAAEPAKYAAHAIAAEVPFSTICRAWASGIDQAMTPAPD